MRYGVAADHAGFPLKAPALRELAALGHSVVDLGGDGMDGDDYPDFAIAVGEAIGSGTIDRGVIICGSGVGVSVAASKIPGIRAAICHDSYSAHQGVEHDNMNVLCLGSRIIGSELALELVRAFAGAEFTNEERHNRRLRKVDAIENRYTKLAQPSGG